MKLKMLPLLLLFAFLVPLLATPPPVYAQVPNSSTVWVAGNGVGTVSTDTALLVKYIGSSASGLVAVAAGGDLTFTQGALSSEAATTTFECPVSGGLGGIIDVSDTACDTLGEVCDVINGAGGSTETGWMCVILDGERSDSSNDTLVTISGTQAKVTGGLALMRDDAVAFKTSIAIVPPQLRLIESYARISGNTKTFYSPSTVFNLSYVPELCSANATTTYGSGTSAWQVRSLAYSSNSRYSLGTETARTIFSTAGGSSTTNKDFTASFPTCLYGNPGEKLVASVVNSAAMTAAAHYAAGKYVKSTTISPLTVP